MEYWNDDLKGMKNMRNSHAHGVIQLPFPTCHYATIPFFQM